VRWLQSPGRKREGGKKEKEGEVRDDEGRKEEEEGKCDAERREDWEDVLAVSMVDCSSCRGVKVRRRWWLGRRRRESGKERSRRMGATKHCASG